MKTLNINRFPLNRTSANIIGEIFPAGLGEAYGTSVLGYCSFHFSSIVIHVVGFRLLAVSLHSLFVIKRVGHLTNLWPMISEGCLRFLRY